MKKLFLAFSVLAMFALPATASAASHAPTVRWNVPTTLEQGLWIDPVPHVRDVDHDLKSVKISWGDSEGPDYSFWHTRTRGTRQMPTDLDTINPVCYNIVETVTVTLEAIDFTGHHTKQAWTVKITPDPEWPSDDVPIIGVSPGHDGIITIGIGT